MNLLNPQLLKEYRKPGPCEHCGRWCNGREAAHIFTKGIGGGSQIDHPYNLVSLGSGWDCGCHAHQHQCNQNPSRDDLLRIVAERERLCEDYIRNTVLYWQNLDVDSPEGRRLLEMEKATR